MEAVQKNINRLDHNSKNIDNLRLWSFFHLLSSQKHCDFKTPSNRLFACVVRVLWPIWISSKIRFIRSAQLWLEKSHVLQFSQKKWLDILKEKSLVHLPKLWLELGIAKSSFLVFDQKRTNLQNSSHTFARCIKLFSSQSWDTPYEPYFGGYPNWP